MITYHLSSLMPASWCTPAIRDTGTITNTCKMLGWTRCRAVPCSIFPSLIFVIRDNRILLYTQWMDVPFSAKSLPSGILITGMLYGNQTHKAYEAVAVGDVGFIRRGYFHCLFNALSPPPDSDSPDGPKYPPRLQPKNPRHLRKSRDNHQAFFSEHVTKLSPQSNVYASG